MGRVLQHCRGRDHERSLNAMSRRQTAAVLLTLLTLLLGCGYGKVSPTTYEFAKALVSVTSRRASDRLPELETRIGEAAAAGELTETEAVWLMAIVNDAQQEKWAAASAAARQIMDDQVER